MGGKDVIFCSFAFRINLLSTSVVPRKPFYYSQRSILMIRRPTHINIIGNSFDCLQLILIATKLLRPCWQIARVFRTKTNVDKS